jgi:hypothetical protein
MQFTGHGELHQFGAEKPISSAKPSYVHFSGINFTLWNHILSTGGDARRVRPTTLIKISQFFMREVTLLFCLQRSCFGGGSIDLCDVPYLGISQHVLGISPHMLMDFNDIHERKKVAILRLF